MLSETTFFFPLGFKPFLGSRGSRGLTWLLQAALASSAVLMCSMLSFLLCTTECSGGETLSVYSKDIQTALCPLGYLES